MVTSSYYRQPSFGKKGNHPTAATFHQKNGLVSQSVVVKFIKDILKHEFIDCGYRLMTKYLNRDGYLINQKNYTEL
jgi:putative transposase